MSERSASVTAARWLLGVTAGVVITFVLATGVSQYLESSIATRSNEIISNAMPSIEMLAAARGELRELDNVIDRYATASIDRRPDIAAKMTALRNSIAVNLTTYASLPFFPNERALQLRAQQNFDTLKTDLAQFAGEPIPQLLAALHRDLDTFDGSLEQINRFDAAQGQRVGLDIQHIRGEARGTAVVLDAISVGLAIVATVLAVRQLQRAAKDEDADRRLRERRVAELASQNEALGDFAGRVAHDILSPLTAATLSFDLIRQTCDDSIAVAGADRGTAAIARVHTLVEALLTYSRAGGQPDPGDSASVASVLTDVISELQLQAQQQGIALELDPIPEGMIACSEGVLTSVVSNLVRNAIKYMGDAPEKRISVRVHEARDRWRIEVEDSGPGVRQEHQLKIFEPYTQIDRRASGIGLGLATVDRLVRAHGGTLGLISPANAGRGSLFWFELPTWSGSALAHTAQLEAQG